MKRPIIRLLIISFTVLLGACSRTIEDVPPPATGYTNTAQPEDTYSQEELTLATSDLGEGAEIVARGIEKVISRYGRPTAYITGREISAAVTLGGRFGDGYLHHKLEGKQPIRWAGPSIGFDFGMSGGESFTLVYNLFDPDELFNWIPSSEVQSYLFGGMNLLVQKNKTITLVTIRLGVGIRLGINAGAVSYSKRDVEEAS